eukprot:5531216-Ditylum_brightwellii.AAC.1
MSGALKLLLQDTPVATVTKHTRHKLFHYYPQQGADSKTTIVYQPASNYTRLLLNYPTSCLRKHFCKIKHGK